VLTTETPVVSRILGEQHNSNEKDSFPPLTHKRKRVVLYSFVYHYGKSGAFFYPCWIAARIDIRVVVDLVIQLTV